MILLRTNLTSNLLVDETDSDNLWHRMAWSKAIGIRSACRAHFRHSNPWWTLLSGTTNHPTQAKSAISIHFFLFPSLSQRTKWGQLANCYLETMKLKLKQKCLHYTWFPHVCSLNFAITWKFPKMGGPPESWRLIRGVSHGNKPIQPLGYHKLKKPPQRCLGSPAPHMAILSPHSHGVSTSEVQLAELHRRRRSEDAPADGDLMQIWSLPRAGHLILIQKETSV